MKNIILNITHDILNLISEIDEFRGEWRLLGKLRPDRLNILRKVATIESIGSSTRIEGAKLSDQEIEKLLQGVKTTSFASRDEEEVVGYAQAMELIFESYNDISLSENHIKQLHAMLLKYSSKDTRHRGEYKKLPNHVEAFDVNGKSAGVIFETTAPFETPEKMRLLIEWTNLAFSEKQQHPLLTIAIFVVCFLAIHPFQDGNGRLSRIITTLLLLQSGYTYIPYSSLEHVVEQNKNNYYLALRRAQSTLDTDNSKLNEWIVQFLKYLQIQKNVLLNKLEKERIMTNLSSLSQAILELAKEHGQITITNLETLTQANRNTLKLQLKNLVAKGYLEKYGQGKNTGYSFRDF